MLTNREKLLNEHPYLAQLKGPRLVRRLSGLIQAGERQRAPQPFRFAAEQPGIVRELNELIGAARAWIAEIAYHDLAILGQTVGAQCVGLGITVASTDEDLRSIASRHQPEYFEYLRGLRELLAAGETGRCPIE